MRQYTDLYYDEHIGESGKYDLWLPDETPRATVVYFHGGGLESGSKEGAGRRMAPYLTERGIALASCNYRLYPEARYPDFIEDAAKAVDTVCRKAEEFGCGRVFIGGSSAGAYLSMMLCFDGRYLEKYGRKATDFAGFLHDSGQPTCHYNVLRERGLDRRRVIVDDSAPVYHVGTAEKYPPMLFIWADHDMKNRPEETEMMLTALDHFGYDPTLIRAQKLHGTHCFTTKATDENGRNRLAVLIGDYAEGVLAGKIPCGRTEEKGDNAL